MHIFCRETTAHLELHPHLSTEESSSGTLITPDLWMKNCKSPEVRSPSPTESSKSFDKPVQLLPLPLVSVTHPSKLIDLGETRRNRLKIHKKSKRRLPATVTCTFIKSPLSDMPQDLRVRHSPIEIESNSKFPHSIDTNSQNDKPDDLSKPLVPPVAGKEATSSNIPNQVNMEEQQATVRNIFEKLLPPPTILYPYPIFLPVPIPIPIPIPITKKTDSPVVTKDVCVQTETKNEQIKIEATEEDTNNYDVDKLTIDNKKEVIIVGRSLRKRKKISEVRSSIKSKRLCNSSN